MRLQERDSKRRLSNFFSRMIKKIIVTGVTGQDGSYMVDYLLKNTHHMIYGMVRRTAKPDYSNLSQSIDHPRFKLVVGDLSDSSSIDSLVKEILPDYFINLAAQSFVGSSWKLPEQTIDVTAVGVVRCLEAIRKHAPYCRFYSAGSSEQFGDVIYAPQDEKHPQRPRSPYGVAKCAAACAVKVWRESYNLYAVHGLLFNHESERRGEEFLTRKVTLGVARIAKALLQGQNFEPIELGNLEAKRDWSHAEDFVDGIWRMLNQEVHNHALNQHCKHAAKLSASHEEPERQFAGWLSSQLQEYVLASGETHTVREFVEKAFAVASIEGRWVKDVNNPIPESERFVGAKDAFGYRTLVKINPAFYRPAEVDLLWGDNSKAREELGWQPKVSFDELVQRMVESDLTS